jgi:hypothetical protein
MLHLRLFSFFVTVLLRPEQMHEDLNFGYNTPITFWRPSDGTFATAPNRDFP